jgi:hypothetical protein
MNMDTTTHSGRREVRAGLVDVRIAGLLALIIFLLIL